MFAKNLLTWWLSRPFGLPFGWETLDDLELLKVVSAATYAAALRAEYRTFQSEFIGFFELALDLIMPPIRRKHCGNSRPIG